MCNWLSRSGFEVTVVDHTGIDIVAYNPSKDQRLGITVKSRTRTGGREDDDVLVFSKSDRSKIHDACKTFGCEPWIAVYVETEDGADLYITSLTNYDTKYHTKSESTTSSWMMKRKYRELYDEDLV